MKKILMYVEYIIGSIFLLFAVILLTLGTIDCFIGSIVSFALAFIFLPSFNMLCKLTNKKFTLLRKIILEIGTLFLSVIPVAVSEVATPGNLVDAIAILIVYWGIVFTTNKKVYDINAITVNKSIKNKELKENDNLLDNMLQYNDNFFKFVGNILSENNDIYVKLNDSSFPKFDIYNISTIIYRDMINYNLPIMGIFNYRYFENLVNKYIKNTLAFKSLKKKEINLLKTINRSGNSRELTNLFDRNMHSFFVSVNDVSKVKIYNNCIINYESEKKEYGIKLKNESGYFEEKIAEYYFYFTDSIISSATIAYLMNFSTKVNSIKENNDEFFTIIQKMLNETTDIELVYKKGYELLENLYQNAYPYIEDKEAFIIFVKMIDNKAMKNDRLNKYLNIDSDLELNSFLYNMANEQVYFDDDELKNIIVYFTKKSSVNSIKILFDKLSAMKEQIDFYKEMYKKAKLTEEKGRFLKGDFSSLKEEAANKQSLQNIHTGTEFEKYLVKLFKDMGYETTHTGKAGDQGCDLLVKKNNKTYCIQAKYYNSNLDNTPVQEIIGSLKHYNGDRGVVITNSSFTSGAYQLAESNNVILINGNKLQKLINYLYSDNDINRDILDEIDYL